MKTQSYSLLRTLGDRNMFPFTSISSSSCHLLYLYFDDGSLKINGKDCKVRNTHANLYFFSVISYCQKFSVYTFLLLTIFIILHFSYLTHYKLKCCRAKTGRFVKKLTADFGSKNNNTRATTHVQQSRIVF